MADDAEKRGPVEKTAKGWPINPFGVVALVFFALIIIFFIAKPLYLSKNGSVDQNFQQNNTGGRLISPSAGEIVKGNNLKIELSVDNPGDVSKVQFWAKAYTDNNWKVIGEATQQPYALDWQIPQEFQNKAIAITSHIITKDAKEIKDPGGWREGVIILSE